MLSTWNIVAACTNAVIIILLLINICKYHIIKGEKAKLNSIIPDLLIKIKLLMDV